MKTFQVTKPYGFRLGAAADFYAGFTPGSGMAAASLAHLTLAFSLDGSFEAVAVALREEGAELVVEYAGTDDEAAVRKQIARILGLDVDGEEWLAVGRRDPVVGKLQRQFPGFFTAAKASPYDAATWGMIAPRLSIAQAAKIKIAMARELGTPVEIDGKAYDVFPSPAVLRSLDRFPGLNDEKVARLRGVAEAALEGRLDAERLRKMPEEAALADLQRLRGVGPWSASHIYFRGAAPPDSLPTVEPRVLHGLAHAAGIEVPSEATFYRLAEAWRPFRMWVCILLSRHLASVGGWHAPGLAEARARAGRTLARRTVARA